MKDLNDVKDVKDVKENREVDQSVSLSDEREENYFMVCFCDPRATGGGRRLRTRR